MKTMIVLAVVGLMAVMVCAGDSHERGYNGCVCGTQCAGNTVTKNIGCRKSRTQYLECVGAVCFNQTCPTNSLFNSTSGGCVPCPSDRHVDATKTRCACNNGTTPDYKTGACVACPSGSILTADRCYCSATTVINPVSKACEPCPATATLAREGCKCKVETQFWNNGAFACQNCPGPWVNKTVTEGRRTTIEPFCTCPTAGQVFVEKTVSCVSCPATSNTVAGDEGNYCQCTVTGQKYDAVTNTCAVPSTQDNDSSSQFF